MMKIVDKLKEGVRKEFFTQIILFQLFHCQKDFTAVEPMKWILYMIYFFRENRN